MNKSWKELEKTLSVDMCTITDYLSAWKLKLSVTKTTSTAFHLNNKKQHVSLQSMPGATPCPITPIQLILGPNCIINWPTNSTVRACVRKLSDATISCNALLACHGVPVHPPFVRQLLQLSLMPRNMLPKLGVIAVTAKNWMLH